MRGISSRQVLIGAAIVVLLTYVAGAAALGTPPESTDSPQSVLDWFRANHDAATFYAWTNTIGSLGFAVIAGIVRSRLPKPHADIFLIAAAAFVAETAVAAWFWAGLALHPDTLEPATARTLLDIATFWGPILTGTTTAMIGAVTALGFRKPPEIPGWLMVIGVIAFLEQLVETVTVFGDDGFLAPGGGMNVVLGAGLTLIWLGALVVWAARVEPAPPPEG